MIESRLSTDGRVTLPVEVREALGIRSGDVVVYELQGDQATLSRRKSGGSEIADLDALIDASLADDRDSLASDKVFADLHARIEERRQRDAA